MDIWTCASLLASPLKERVEVVQRLKDDSRSPVASYWLWRFDRIDDEVPLDNFWGKTETEAISDLQRAANPVVGNPQGTSEVELAVDPYFPATIPTVPAEVRGYALHRGGRNRLFLDGHAEFNRDRRLQ